MVFCKFKEYKNNKIVYAIGGSPSDITGEIIIDIDNNSYDLLEPENSKLYDRHIVALIHREMESFKKGVFKDKLSYEIG